jgi:hypothetical protein
MQKLITATVSCLLIAITYAASSATAQSQTACHNHAATAQERIAQRDLQQVIDQGIEEWAAHDLDAVALQMEDDITLQLLDGTTLNRAQLLEGMRRDLDSLLRIDTDRTYTRIECLTLAGPEATIYTYQQYVRTMPDRKDGSPHEVITSIRHRELWVFSKQGWRTKHIQELEQGPTFLDGQPYDPS